MAAFVVAYLLVIFGEKLHMRKSRPDISILPLPVSSDKEINALQRAAAVVLQKSVKEGFGLTVSGAM